MMGFLLVLSFCLILVAQRTEAFNKGGIAACQERNEENRTIAAIPEVDGDAK